MNTTTSAAIVEPQTIDCDDCAGTGRGDCGIYPCSGCLGTGVRPCDGCGNDRPGVHEWRGGLYCGPCLVEHRAAAERSPAVQQIVAVAFKLPLGLAIGLVAVRRAPARALAEAS